MTTGIWPISTGSRCLEGTCEQYLFEYNIPMSTISLRIRELRLARRWSQAQLAARARVRQATISKIESGQLKRLDLKVLDRLATALEVDPGYLIVRASRGR